MNDVDAMNKLIEMINQYLDYKLAELEEQIPDIIERRIATIKIEAARFAREEFRRLTAPKTEDE